MTKKDILEYFYTNNANLTGNYILFILLSAVVVSLVIYFTYKITHKGVAYNRTFNTTLVILHLICVVIMLMISSNIVISLGMVGSLSIIRFRTAIKDSRDTMFIFWTIAEGLSVGSQNFKLAIISTLFIALIMLLFNRIPKMVSKYLIVVTGNKIDTNKLIDKMNNTFSGTKSRTANANKNLQEYIFEVSYKGKKFDVNIINEIMKFKGVNSVNCVSESGETIG